MLVCHAWKTYIPVHGIHDHGCNPRNQGSQCQGMADPMLWLRMPFHGDGILYLFLSVRACLGNCGWLAGNLALVPVVYRLEYRVHVYATRVRTRVGSLVLPYGYTCTPWSISSSMAYTDPVTAVAEPWPCQHASRVYPWVCTHAWVHTYMSTRPWTCTVPTGSMLLQYTSIGLPVQYSIF